MIDWSSKPWNADATIPSEIFAAKGMIGEEERKMLFFLGAHNFMGDGRVVDAGCFLGASTFALASGVAATGLVDFARPPVAAFDYFKAIDDYVTDYISSNFRPIDREGDYLDLFNAQTDQYRDLIEVFPGDFSKIKWIGDPIEVLFVDVAKTAELNAHVFCEFLPHLIPGYSVIVQQDYFHCWHPYMQICMEYLDKHFELLDPRVLHQSRLWRLITPIPPGELQRCRVGGISFEEGCTLLDRLIERSRPEDRPMMMVTKLEHLRAGGRFSEAHAYVSLVEEECCTTGGRWAVWSQQLARIRSLLPPA